MSEGWKTVPVSEVLHIQRRWIEPEPSKEYVEIGIRSFGKGIFHKAPVSGSSLGEKRVLRIEPGDLVFNNVFAWEGAVAVAGEQEVGKIGSHRFLTYAVDPEKSTAQYLKLFFAAHAGREILGRASPGSAGRNRTLAIERFAAQKVPLPPLAEQRRIVVRVEGLATKIEEARRLRGRVGGMLPFLLQTARARLVGSTMEGSWVRLGAFVQTIENGWSPACEARPANGQEWGVLKLGAVSFGTYNPGENKALPVDLRPMEQFEIRPGDFLMTRANTASLVGACASVVDTPPRRMLCDKIFRLVFRDASSLNLHYLEHVLKSPALRTQIMAGATGTSATMKNISKQRVLDLRVPKHSLEEQREIASQLGTLEGRVAELARLQAETQAELDALLPSVLDRAFRGEL